MVLRLNMFFQILQQKQPLNDDIGALFTHNLSREARNFLCSGYENEIEYC